MSNTSNLVALKEGNNPSQDALSLFLCSNLCQVSLELVNQVRIINTWKLQGIGGSLVNVTGIQLCCHQDFSRPSHDSLTPFPFPFSKVQQSETNFPQFLKTWFPGFWRENFSTTCSTFLPFWLYSGDKPCSFWTTVAWGQPWALWFSPALDAITFYGITLIKSLSMQTCEAVLLVCVVITLEWWVNWVSQQWLGLLCCLGG